MRIEVWIGALILGTFCGIMGAMLGANLLEALGIASVLAIGLPLFIYATRS